MTTTLPHQTTEPSLDDYADDYDHVVCCNNNRALCGEDVSDVEWCLESEADNCPMCAVLKDLPTCGALLCRLRQRLRR